MTRADRINEARSFFEDAEDALASYDLMVVKCANSHANAGVDPVLAMIMALQQKGIIPYDC